MSVRDVQSMSMIRNLAGLVLVLSLLPIGMSAFRFTSSIPFAYTEVFDELALMQLRESLLIAYGLNIDYDSLSFSLHNKDFVLSQVNDKLIMHPGTQIFLADVDDLHFEKRNGVVYVCYERKGKNYERVIVSARGFYLDDFSDCDVRDDGTDCSEE